MEINFKMTLLNILKQQITKSLERTVLRVCVKGYYPTQIKLYLISCGN